MTIIVDRIYKGLLELDEDQREEYRKKKRVHKRSLTASIIEGCRRANWYAIKDLRPDKSFERDPVMLSKFRDGHKAHIDLGVLLYDCGIKILGREIDNTCKGVFVRIDYRIQIDGQAYNLEYKTMDGRPFATFLKYGIVAFPGYLAQCQLMAGSEPLLPSIVLCKNKGGSDYGEEFIKPDWEFIDNLAKIKEDFDEDIDSNTPPERPFDYNSAPCGGCEYRFWCWFSKIRSEVIIERDLNENEKAVVDTLYQTMQDNYETYNKYLGAESELKNYIAFLHTKHAVSKVKLTGITSSLVETRVQSYDMDYIRSMLTLEQIGEAIKFRENKYFRTTIR